MGENEKKRGRKEQVISKLKDDGDFDRLRLKIIRKLKDNEELRKNIISVIKQSAVLNRPAAENMKPRQLSDAIYEDVREKVQSQISDGLWAIIRSEEDGMKSEIAETVESVYNKLVNPGGVEPSTGDDVPLLDKEADNEPNEPPGFSLSPNHNNNVEHEQACDDNDEDPEVPPGFG